MFEQMVMMAGIADVYQGEDQEKEETERRKGNILYLTDGSDESVLLADRIVFGNNNNSVQMTFDTLGVSGMLSRKRQGFNALLCDFEIFSSVSCLKAIKAIKKFTKRSPNMPVFIFCDDQQQYCHACSLFGKSVKNISLKSWSALPIFVSQEMEIFLEEGALETV